MELLLELYLNNLFNLTSTRRKNVFYKLAKNTDRCHRVWKQVSTYLRAERLRAPLGVSLGPVTRMRESPIK